MVTKAEADEIMKHEGTVKGLTLLTDADYVKGKWGSQGVAQLSAAVSNLGYSINYDKVKPFDDFPLGLRVLSLLAIKDLFQLSDDGLKEVGYAAPNFSIIAKIMMWAFNSPKMVMERFPSYWEKHYNAGQIDAIFFAKDSYALVTLSNFSLHPLFCKYLEGYISKIMELTFHKTVLCSEQSCTHRGDTKHVFKFSWG